MTRRLIHITRQTSPMPQPGSMGQKHRIFPGEVA